MLDLFHTPHNQYMEHHNVQANKLIFKLAAVHYHTVRVETKSGGTHTNIHKRDNHKFWKSGAIFFFFNKRTYVPTLK